MLRVSAVDRCPRRQLFHRQIGPRDWALAPQKVFDFLGVLLQHSEIQVVKIEELADFVGESCSQLLRFAARGDRLADAHNGFTTQKRGGARPLIHPNYQIHDDSLPLGVATGCTKRADSSGSAYSRSS